MSVVLPRVLSDDAVRAKQLLIAIILQDVCAKMPFEVCGHIF